MAKLQEVWRLEPDGGLAAEVGDFRLIVKRPGIDGALVQFLVMHRNIKEYGIINSGTEADVRSAMHTAARIAERLIRTPGPPSF